MNWLDYTLSVQDIISWLHISRQTLYNWIDKEGFPYKIIGVRKKFNKEEVIKWYRKNKQ